MVDFWGEDAVDSDLWSRRRRKWNKHCKRHQVDRSLGPNPAQLGSALVRLRDAFGNEDWELGWARAVAEASKGGFCGPTMSKRVSEESDGPSEPESDESESESESASESASDWNYSEESGSDEDESSREDKRQLKVALRALHTLDATDKGIDSGGCTLIAWWLSTPAAALVVSLTISSECTHCP